MGLEGCGILVGGVWQMPHLVFGGLTSSRIVRGEERVWHSRIGRVWHSRVRRVWHSRVRGV